ncbi:MAG: ATP-binding cassette domain-containing protein [Candidatus Eisenbacteria bacterium]
MLEVRNVTKVFDDRKVVNDVTFDVKPGEIFALLGQNGAGKTTLIRMITDITRPDSGTITLEGQPVTSPSRPRIAYLPEERGLYRKVSVLEALAYYGELKDLSRKEARRQAVELLEEVELAGWAKKHVHELSKGMQQKVQMCTALIGDPKLLVLDEPFSGLDPVNVRLLEDILKKRRETGVTVLLSTHQINKVEQLCDRCLMIHRGHMVLYGTVREIRRQYAEHAVYVSASTPLPSDLEGVIRMERADDYSKLVLQRSAEAGTVLKSLIARGVAVDSFQPAQPPLEDIFRHVADTGSGLDQGRSGKLGDDAIAALSGGVR